MMMMSLSMLMWKTHKCKRSEVTGFFVFIFIFVLFRNPLTLKLMNARALATTFPFFLFEQFISDPLQCRLSLSLALCKCIHLQ